MCARICGSVEIRSDPNPRTVVEEQQHSEAQGGCGQQNQTDVAGDHEVAHHQGHLVLVPALLIQRRWRGIMAPAHAPLQRPPPLQRGGEDGPRRAARGAQRPVGKNDGDGVRAEDGDEVKKPKSRRRYVRVGVLSCGSSCTLWRKPGECSC